MASAGRTPWVATEHSRGFAEDESGVSGRTGWDRRMGDVIGARRGAVGPAAGVARQRRP
jgi:hypothetical protein